MSSEQCGDGVSDVSPGYIRKYGVTRDAYAYMNLYASVCKVHGLTRCGTSSAFAFWLGAILGS